MPFFIIILLQCYFQFGTKFTVHVSDCKGAHEEEYVVHVSDCKGAHEEEYVVHVSVFKEHMKKSTWFMCLSLRST